jgi:diguanylate cyclase (GGDEF)-like protein/PAS domain S-box-containing protein
MIPTMPMKRSVSSKAADPGPVPRPPSSRQIIEAIQRLRGAVDNGLSQGDVLSTLIEHIPDYIFVKDRNSRFLLANSVVARDLGLHTGGSLVGRSDFELHDWDRAIAFYRAEQEIMATGRPMLDLEESVVTREGHEKWLLTSKMPLRDADGVVVGLVGVSRDITERRRIARLHAAQADVLERIAKNRPLAEVLTRIIELIEENIRGVTGSILLLDEDGIHLRTGAAPGLPAEMTAAISGAAIGPAAGSCGTAAYRRRPVAVGDIETDPLWADYRWLVEPHGFKACWSTPVLSETGAVLATFALYARTKRLPTPSEDELITTAARLVGIAVERNAAENRIRFMALHDGLTGLPNRSELRRRLGRRIAAAGYSDDGRDHRLAVAFVDLDNFKVVNDSLGHGAGDQLLQTIAGRMQASVGPRDLVAREGGDEFVVLYDTVPDCEDEILVTIERLRSVIAEPINVAGKPYSVTASVGLAIYPEDGEDADTLLSNADAAMYQAKTVGRDNVQPFRRDMRAAAEDRLALTRELGEAVRCGQLRLAYQPQIELATGRIVSVEALLRWDHARIGPISPERFVPLAESTGAIVAIGGWALTEACRQAAAWQAAGAQPVTVCVNISAQQFRTGLLERQVCAALEASGFDPHRLELELTESMLMHDEEMAIATMTTLRRLGVRFAIDDFGTGYSSFASLKRLPVSRIKIDKSFIRDLDDDDSDRAITAAIILMARQLKLRVVAEGVETAGQHTFLVANGCDEAQGYRYSRAVTGEALADLLLGRTTAAAAGDGGPGLDGSDTGGATDPTDWRRRSG